jgi:hypothetical protein
MSEYPSWLQVVSQLFETKFGDWQQPDLLDPCRTGLGGCPVQWTTGYELRKLTVSWIRAQGETPAQDAAMCTFHFLNLTAGNPDATWTTADYTTIEGLTPAKYTVEDVEGVGAQQRNRWGRFYLPAPSNLDVVAGRVPPSFCEVVAIGAQTFYNAAIAADLIPVMYSPTTGSAWAINAIHVDDIYDVIRSRRYITPLSRHSKTVNAP